MHKLVFTGPTLSWNDIQCAGLQSPLKRLENIDEVHQCNADDIETIFVIPPVAGGDLYKIKDYRSPFVIAIIDGYFENRISVWHREILYLLSKNIPVYGSSSMGALRAAELSPYGMVGIGEIYKNFANATYEDDDEVTVSHGPAELGYPQISEALVNIRFTLHKALQDHILEESVQQTFLNVAKKTFYKKRNYGSIIRECIEHHGMNEKDFVQFFAWLTKHRIDQKKLDALALIRKIDSKENIPPTENKTVFTFEDTTFWRDSIGA